MSLAPTAPTHPPRCVVAHRSSPAIRALPVNPQGTEYHVSMSKILPQRCDAEYSGRLARADVLLRHEPDEEEEEEEKEEEDEGDVTNDEGNDDEEDGGGYSVGMYR